MSPPKTEAQKNFWQREDLSLEESPPSLSLLSLQNKMLSAGIDSDLICNVIKDGLTAEKKEEPDHSARLKYLELAMELLEIIPIKKRESDDHELLFKDYSRLSDQELEEEYGARIEALRLFKS